jgi:hypothetical protein
MTRNDTTRLRANLIEFCNELDWKNPQAVTLTLKLARYVDGVRIKLTRQAAEQNLRHLKNVLRKKLVAFGFDKREVLHCVPIFEGNSTVREHIHLMLDRPKCIQVSEYADLIQREWARTVWGHGLVLVEPCYDQAGWLDYITKPRTKSDSYAVAIDWTNFN